MKNVFIDTNIWLSLYHFSNDDLEQFSKLKERVGRDIRLFLTSQVVDEITRNRDNKIQDAFKEFEKFCFRFPAFCKNYDEYSAFYDDYSALQKRHKEWCQKIKTDINNRALPADMVLKDFFDNVSVEKCTDTMVHRAEVRFKKGNPPGKNNSFGDAINWECLLETVPESEDLFFISADKDYASVIDTSKFNLFLREEWRQRKNAKIIFFTSLVSFLKEHFADIKILEEQEKEDLISELSSSCNFAMTHNTISKLKKYTGWNEQQISEILEAACVNSQIYWILGDDDVFEFYSDILNQSNSGDEFEMQVRGKINEIEKQRRKDNDELPF